ncbi:MAG: winged helix-turn-helix domain-containing protein [Ideonella sp.]|nr:winged helix-turn-helix domain-containing protein [Ideonella sp.]
MDPSNRSPEPGVLSFGPFVLDNPRALLTRDGAAVPLRPKTFALLSALAADADRVVGKQKLLATVWPGLVVSDDSLSQCVNELRVALDDRDHNLIKTVSRRGYRLDLPPQAPAADTGAPTAPPASAQAPTLPRRARWLGATVAAALTIAALGAFMQSRDAQAPAAGAVRRSIAVLPLSDLSEERRGYFADGVTEDLVTELAGLPGMLVVGSKSAAVSAGPQGDLRKLGRDLNVRYALTGSLRRNGTAVQINAQFAATDSGAVLWSERFDYPTGAEWTWQRDIARRIAQTLHLKLADAEAILRGHRQAEAIDAVMQGQHIMRTSTAPADVLRARGHFEAALALDTGSVNALCGLAQTYAAQLRGLWSDDRETHLQQAERAVERALALDSGSPMALYTHGHVLALRGRLEEALRSYEKVVELRPGDSWAHTRIGLTKLELGRLSEVAAHVAEAKRLNPFEPTLRALGHFIAGSAEFHLQRDDDAYEHMRQSAALNGQNPAPWLYMAAMDGLRDRPEAATRNLEQARRLQAGLTVGALKQANRRADEGPNRAGRERFYAGLTKAGMTE